MPISFCEVLPGDSAALARLEALAQIIWQEHYTPIIGEKQVAYMLEHFQSKGALEEQLTNEGYRYFILQAEEEDVGYLGIRNDRELLFLSKLYLERRFRGQGISRVALEKAKEIARENGNKGIYLTVNKNNRGSVAAYEKLGFSTVRQQKAEIGGGYVMDDYIMQLDF